MYFLESSGARNYTMTVLLGGSQPRHPKLPLTWGPKTVVGLWPPHFQALVKEFGKFKLTCVLETLFVSFSMSFFVLKMYVPRFVKMRVFHDSLPNSTLIHFGIGKPFRFRKHRKTSISVMFGMFCHTDIMWYSRSSIF